MVIGYATHAINSLSLSYNKITRLANLAIHQLHLAEHYVRRDHDGPAQWIERFNLECEEAVYTPVRANCSHSRLAPNLRSP